jgi:hypothetical protein
MFAAGKTAAVSGAAPDGQFNYVTMLLHGDGTNGAQNNTFLDSGPNTFTITRNGNTTQGSFSPYGSNWSNYFNGSSDYLGLGTSTNLALGAGDFTIEVWLSVTAYNASTSNIFEWRSAGGTPSNIPTLYLSASGVPIFYASVGAGALITGSSAVALNTWTHLAIVRSGSTVTMYLNGTSVGSATNSADLGTQSFYINDPQGTFRHNGYFSNVRMVKGTAVYTGSFTPSTTPLTAITNTQLLTCQSNRFVDNSANAFSSTITGTPSVQRFNPFGASTAYSTSVIGGSGYFDGTGDYLTTPNVTALNLGNTFTIEAWVYLSSTSVMQLASCRDSSAGGCWQFVLNWNGSQSNGALAFKFEDGNVPVGTSSDVVKRNAWTHVAVCRSGSSFELFCNGVRVATGTNSTTFPTPSSAVFIGSLNNPVAEQLNGYMCDLRLLKNTALYSGTTYTVPTAPLTAITNTSLLLNYTNGAIFDNAMMNNLETAGNAQISTSVVKYGTGSLAFDGTGDWLAGANYNTGNFGAGDFTVELWLKTASSSGGPCVVSQATGGGAAATSWGLFLGYASSTSIDVYLSNGSSYFASTGGGNVTDNAWHHVAFSRSGSSGKLFLDGVQVGSTLSLSTTALGNGTAPIYVASQGGSYPITGYIDDLRITKGYARYTATFTPPTSALSDTGPI